MRNPNHIEMNFLERALDKENQWWKYLVVILVGQFGGIVLGSIPLIIAIIFNSTASELVELDLSDLAQFGISKNAALLLFSLPHIAILLLYAILIKGLHRRSFRETINGTTQLRYGRMALGFGVWFALMAVFYLGDYLINPDDYVLQFNLNSFLWSFFLTFLLIPLQVTSEEFVYRGYYAHGITALTKNRWMVLLVSSIIFALAHRHNPEVKEFGFLIAMPQYLFFGLIFGLTSVLDDGLELPIGMHAGNNIFLSLFITHKADVLQTNAVFEVIDFDPVKDLVLVVAIGIISFAYFAYRYRWNFRVLSKRVDKGEYNSI